MGKHEVWQDNRIVNESISLLYYDANDDKFRRKYAFSYCFVNNEIEYYRDEKTKRFQIEVEPEPVMFKGTRWRSFIRIISDKEVHLGLEVAKRDDDFKSFGVTVLKR